MGLQCSYNAALFPHVTVVATLAARVMLIPQGCELATNLLYGQNVPYVHA